MKTRTTEKHTYLLDSDIELWLEQDAYCPMLVVKRPKRIKNSYTSYSQAMEPFEQIIEENESLFIEDLIYNLIARKEISNNSKLKTVKQLRGLVDKMERMVKEKIECEQLEDEDLSRSR